MDEAVIIYPICIATENMASFGSRCLEAGIGFMHATFYAHALAVDSVERRHSYRVQPARQVASTLLATCRYLLPPLILVSKK